MVEERARRLAAILAADVVGYSRLMGEDEEATLATLAGHRGIIDALIRRHAGRVFGSAGDSVLAEFASPVEAVRAATEIQLALEQQNAGVAEPRRMRLRIGVNLGDVLVEGDNLMGDGVNVAARLEALARPGGVCISSAVVEHVQDRLGLEFEDLGPQVVKNIARPVRVFRVPLASEFLETSPFRGLEVFEVEHADIFHGRAQAIATTKERLEQRAQAGIAFLLIHGMSGAGKSSLLRAGLLPAVIRPGAVDGVDHWRHCVFRPSEGASPRAALAQALVREQALPELAPAALLLDPPAQAVATIDGVLGRAGIRHEKLMVGVDQLEELFTGERIDGAERAAFVALLEALARSGTVWVAATLRTDFLHHCAPVPGLSQLKDGLGSYELLPPSGPEIAQIIRNPARTAGLRFEEDPREGRLEDVLQQAAASDPASLPLLEFVLDALYEAGKARRLLTFADYRALGGLEGAIASRAEQVVTALPADIQAALPAVLRALTTIRQRDETVTSRPAPRAEAAATPAQAAAVEALIGGRLLVSDETTGGEVVVRLAHEALLSHWPRAQAIVAADREFLASRARVQAEARRWLAESRSADLLLPPGKRLAEAEELLTERADELDPDVRDYVRASLELARASDRKRLRRVQAFAAAMAVLAVLAGIGGWLGYTGQQRAERQAVLAEREASAARAAEAEAARQAELAASSRNQALRDQSHYLSDLSQRQTAAGDTTAGILLALEALPEDMAAPDRPYVVEAEAALYAAVQAHREVAVLSGHEGPVTDGAFSPDGSRMVTVSFDQTARLWDVPSGDEVAVLSGHRQPVVDVAYSPDGTLLATASTDRTARVWDATSGDEIAVLEGHGGAVVSVAFSPDGGRVLTASKDKTARLYDARSGAELAVLAGHGRGLVGALFTPDGHHAVTASADRTARTWDLATGTPTAVLAGHGRDVGVIAIDPDGVWVATGSTDRTARLWDLATGEPAAVLSGHEGRIDAIAFSRDGTRVVTGSADGTARIWDVAGNPIATLEGHEAGVTDLEFSSDGTRIVSASQDGTVRIWQGVTGAAIAVLRGHGAAVTSVTMSRDGSYALSTSNDGTARLWRALSEIGARALSQTGQRGGRLQNDPSFGTHAEFSPDGAKIVSISESKTAYLWDGRDSRSSLALVGHDDWITHAAFSPDGNTVVTSSVDGTARLWRSNDGEQIAVLRGHTGQVWHAAFDPSSRHVATVSHDSTARIWDTRTGDLRAVLRDHELPVVKAAFSPDGRLLATASMDQTVRLWQVDDGKLQRTLGGHSGSLYHVTFSPDGRDILAASSDTVIVWDVRTGSEILRLLTHGPVQGRIWSTRYSPDGTLMVTTSVDSTRVWDASTQTLMLDGSSYAEFSPNGQRIVTAGNGTSKLWDVATGGEIAAVDLHEGWGESAVFDSTGRRVVTAADDGVTRVFDVFPTTQALIDHARSSVSRQLTACERQRFFLPVDGEVGDCR